MTYSAFQRYRTSDLISALIDGESWPQVRARFSPNEDASEDAVWAELDRRLMSGRSAHANDQVPSHVDTPEPGMTWGELAAVNSGRLSLSEVLVRR